MRLEEVRKELPEEIELLYNSIIMRVKKELRVWVRVSVESRKY